MACNVPMIVWNINDLSQEYGENSYNPYWSNLCGEVFYNKDELEQTFDIFIHNLKNGLYTPRAFILNNLDIPQCSKIFHKLLITT